MRMSPQSDTCLSLLSDRHRQTYLGNTKNISPSFNVCFGKSCGRRLPPPHQQAPIQSRCCSDLARGRRPGQVTAAAQYSSEQDLGTVNPGRNLIWLWRKFGIRKYFPRVVDDQMAPMYKIYTELYKRPQYYFLPSLFLFSFSLWFYKTFSKWTRNLFLNGYHIIYLVLTMSQMLLRICTG